MSTHQKNQEKALVIYSGGMDSFTLLQEVMQTHHTSAISFDYGQRHRQQELTCAQHICKEDNIHHHIVDIRSIGALFSQQSALMNTQIELPKGPYHADNLSTVVPNRNMVFLSIAIAYALSIHAQSVYYGAHQDDHVMYPDCRPQFIDAMNHAAHLCDWKTVEIKTPYLKKSKADILKIGLDIGLDYAKTWTCYDEGQKACGQCSACTVRLNAFAVNNMIDPIAYI